MKRKGIIALIIVVTIILSGCTQSEREYLAHITVPLEGCSAEIVIKEWRWLLGSGAEIYYKQNSELTLLGTTTGGDDGYCPFAAGQYTLTTEENTLLVRWHFADDVWKEDRFPLPALAG